MLAFKDYLQRQSTEARDNRQTNLSQKRRAASIAHSLVLFVLLNLGLASCSSVPEESPPSSSIDALVFQANHGDSAAQYELGLVFFEGNNTEVDYFEAFDWFTLSAAAGDARAHNKLGYLYLNELVGEKNEELAIYHFKQAAMGGHATAQYNLAVLYSEKAKVAQSDYDYEQSLLWAERAAISGLAVGQRFYGALHMSGDATTKDTSKGFYWLSQAAEQDYALAQHELALLYRDGIGTDVDLQQAYNWLFKAWSNGHLPSSVDVANILREGLVSSKDPDTAFTILESASEQGEALGQYNLSRMYTDGEGTIVDHDKAFYWMEQASESTLEPPVSLANLAMGVMYSQGVGVKKDPVRACEYFERSSRAGSEEASRFAANCYLSGEGLGENTSKAIEYLELSSEQGSSVAPLSLALLYLRGDKISKNRQEARDWLQVAAERDNQQAKELIVSLGRTQENEALKLSFESAVKLLDRGKYAQAEKQFLHILDQSSQEVDVFVMLGIAQFRLEKYQKSVETLEKAHELFPDNSRVLGLLAISCLKNGDERDALHYAEKSLAIDPHNEQVRDARDHAAFYLSKYSNAELDQMLETAFGHLADKKPKEAEKLFEKTLRILTNSSSSYVYLAVSLSMQGRYTEAAAILKEGNAAHPNSVDILANLGYVEFLQGNYAEAVAYYEMTLAIDPDHKNTIVNLREANKKYAKQKVL